MAFFLSMWMSHTQFTRCEHAQQVCCQSKRKILSPLPRSAHFLESALNTADSVQRQQLWITVIAVKSHQNTIRNTENTKKKVSSVHSTGDSLPAHCVFKILLNMRCFNRFIMCRRRQTEEMNVFSHINIQTLFFLQPWPRLGRQR